MDLGKLVENEDRRLMNQAALAAAALGLLTTLNGVVALAADGAGSAMVAIGLLQLGLAYGVYRGSRACAMAVFGLFLLDRLAAFAMFGLRGVLSVWTVILVVVLFAGLRATFADHQRRSAAPRPAVR